VENLRRFLAKKYREKAWYDPVAAAKPVEIYSDAAQSGTASTWSPQASGRKRVGSASSTGGATHTSGASEHRNFLAGTHARAAAASAASSAAAAAAAADDDDGVDDSDEDQGDGESEDPVAKERRRRERIRSQIGAFYRIHNIEKLDSLDAFVDWVMYHGMPAFNKKLREKYGTDIELSGQAKKSPNLKNKRGEKKVLQARFSRSKSIMNPDVDISRLEGAAREMALIDLSDGDNAGGSGSTNPFDAAPIASVGGSGGGGRGTSSSNPFDML
jgi:hypothetical protein